MRFDGFCTYPFGGKVSLALIVSTCAALAATVYATASCRFVVVSFTSTAGGLEDYFANRRIADDSPAQYKAGVGLYQWLRPNDPEEGDWAAGACAGYQETMLNRISDGSFEAARTFAIFAILMSIVETLWVFLSACFALNRVQGVLFCVLSAVGTLSTAMTFLFLQSALCQTAFDARKCSIDEGGLVMIAAVVLWMITFCVSAFFAYPTIAESYIVDFARQDAKDKAKLQSKIAQNRAKSGSGTKARASRPAVPPVGRSYSYDSQKSWTRPIPSRTSRTGAAASSSSQQRKSRPVQQYAMTQRQSTITVDDISTNDQMEVYISKRLNRIDQLAEV